MFRDFSNYDVLPSGRIWSKVSNKWLKPTNNGHGYLQVGLYDNEGKRHMERLHKVIYCAVNGLWNLPEGYELNHLDEDKTNNAISNLQLCTRKENNNWGTRTERASKANTNHPSMSKRVAAFKDGELVMVFPSTKEAERQGFNQGHVSACCNGERKSHKGYEWKYLDGEEN